MKNPVLLVICALLLLPPATTLVQATTAGPNPQKLSADQSEERIATDLSRYQASVPRIRETLEALKEEKASYLQELTASPADVRYYRTPKEQRQMVGVYLFDMTYASVFTRQSQSRASGEALQQLLKSLGFNDRQVNQEYQKLIKESEASTSQIMVNNFEDILNNYFREIAKSDEGVALIGDAAYGWLIEGLYVTLEIVAQQNYAPMMLFWINDQARGIQPVTQLLSSVNSNPRLARLITNQDERAVLTALATALQDSERISRKEIDALRVIVSKARAKFIH